MAKLILVVSIKCRPKCYRVKKKLKKLLVPVSSICSNVKKALNFATQCVSYDARNKNGSFILLCALQIHGVFHGKFSTECDLVLPISISSILSFT
jgi:hypothetical protein